MTAINLATFTDRISDTQLEQLCADNPEARFETTPSGELIIMSPTGSLTGEKNSDLLIQIGIWNRQHKLGKIFDSSTGFKLSNGATRSPDVSWIEINRWLAIPKAQQRKFAPIDPDFIIELMSPTDDLDELRNKMNEYINCGVKLGWLICPDEKQVEIYRQGQEKEVLDNPGSLSGEDVLPKLIVDFTDIFAD
ncbi:Uma2 family endonuclease [Myxosarcina sp. GI1]|uniref:Uma2 family endonuclease n=1 Tax=Myxosarcina sp. GI1 TaxID=1541065 RepID=UPI000565C46B|nr:Uma2 family endonuclease [Myxosarcina sp. GI1]